MFQFFLSRSVGFNTSKLAANNCRAEMVVDLPAAAGRLSAVPALQRLDTQLLAAGRFIGNLSRSWGFWSYPARIAGILPALFVPRASLPALSDFGAIARGHNGTSCTLNGVAPPLRRWRFSVDERLLLSGAIHCFVVSARHYRICGAWLMCLPDFALGEKAA